jgi:hypothetical protein
VRKRLLPILTVLLVVLAFQALALACPNCKDSIPSSDAQNMAGVPAGFNNSVYLLLGAFLGVLSFIVGAIWRAK